MIVAVEMIFATSTGQYSDFVTSFLPLSLSQTEIVFGLVQPINVDRMSLKIASILHLTKPCKDSKQRRTP